MEELRDTIVVLGTPEEKLLRLLAKLGYRLERADEKSPLSLILERQVVDLILIDGGNVTEYLDILEHLRKDELTKKVPVVLCELLPAAMRNFSEQRVERCDVVERGSSPASISAKIATQLRLRKIAGSDANSASMAETNAMLRDLTTRFSKELEEARKIQEGLLPKVLPTGDSYQLAATYRPLEQVGGDWYFVRSVEGGKISIQIADVTGHGLSAAFICSMTKLALNAVVGSAGESEQQPARECPAQLLEKMNLLMAPQLPEERFVTAATVLYDPGSGDLQYARAGHPPAILFRRADQSFAELKGQGFALGIMPDGEYELLSDKLSPGDVLVLYTDGLTEGQNRSLELYGSARMVEVLKKLSSEAKAEEVQKALLDDFTTFTEGRILKDDVTLVILKRVT